MATSLACAKKQPKMLVLKAEDQSSKGIDREKLYCVGRKEGEAKRAQGDGTKARVPEKGSGRK